MNHYNFKTVAGCFTRVTCNVTAPEGVRSEVCAYMMYEGESRAVPVADGGVVMFPALPYGQYAYDLRCGEKPVMFGHLLVRPSAYPQPEGAVDYSVDIDLPVESPMSLRIALTPGPKGEPGESFTFEDITEEQRAELMAPVAAHVADGVVHVSAKEREEWNAKAEVAEVAKQGATLANHVADGVVHVSAEEREAWNAKADVAEVVMDTWEDNVSSRAGASGIVRKMPVDGFIKRVELKLAGNESFPDTPMVLEMRVYAAGDAGGAVLRTGYSLFKRTVKQYDTYVVFDMGQLLEVHEGELVDMRFRYSDKEGEVYAPDYSLAETMIPLPLAISGVSAGSGECVYAYPFPAFSDEMLEGGKTTYAEIAAMRITLAQMSDIEAGLDKRVKALEGSDIGQLLPRVEALEEVAHAVPAEPRYKGWLIVADEVYGAKITEVGTLGPGGAVYVYPAEGAFTFSGETYIKRPRIAALAYVVGEGGGSGLCTAEELRDFLIAQWGAPGTNEELFLVPMV